MSGNKKNFRFSSVSSKTFSFILDYFEFSSSFVSRIRQYFKISFIMSIINQLFSNVRIKSPKLLFSFKWKASFVRNIKIREIYVISIIKEIQKWTNNLKLATIKITSSIRSIEKRTLLLNIKKIKMETSMLRGIFYNLLVYDPQTLGTLDTKTLGEMDYITI